MANAPFNENGNWNFKRFSWSITMSSSYYKVFSSPPLEITPNTETPTTPSPFNHVFHHLSNKKEVQDTTHKLSAFPLQNTTFKCVCVLSTTVWMYIIIKRGWTHPHHYHHDHIMMHKLIYPAFFTYKSSPFWDHPVNLSILITGGKENNNDSLSNGEWTGKSSMEKGHSSISNGMSDSMSSMEHLCLGTQLG